MLKRLLILPHAMLPNLSKHMLAIVGGLAVMLLGAVTAFGTVPQTETYSRQISDIVEQQEIPTLALETGSSPAVVIPRETRIRTGDTVATLLARAGVADDAAIELLQNERGASMLFRQLAPGRLITAGVTLDGQLASLIFPLNGGDSILQVQRTTSGFTVETLPIVHEKTLTLQTAVIRHSLFGAADEAGIPESVATGLADIFGGDIDFHRDIRKGDRFSVLYESWYHQGRLVRADRILAAEFANGNKTYRAYWYQPKKEDSGGYYSENGHSIKKAFLRSPLEFSRISSGFSNARFHPVLQEIRAHRGVDYAAPVGTRVKATGDGIVEYVGIQGGYGKVIMIRHAGDKLTVYGHLSGFASGLHKGNRVRQGDIIGYVGATGLASGPHLHYEFRVAGIHRDPLKIALPNAPALSQVSLPQFRLEINTLTSQLDAIKSAQLMMLD